MSQMYGHKLQPFISVTVNELLFGYEDTLVNMAHTFYPRNIRPGMSKMGLLLGVSVFQIYFAFLIFLFIACNTANAHLSQHGIMCVCVVD